MDSPDTNPPQTPSEAMRLSDRDWEAVMAALENPPEPGPALKKLMSGPVEGRRRIRVNDE